METPDLTGIDPELIAKVQARIAAREPVGPLFEAAEPVLPPGVMKPEVYQRLFEERANRANAMRQRGVDPRDGAEEPITTIPGTAGVVSRR